MHLPQKVMHPNSSIHFVVIPSGSKFATSSFGTPKAFNASKDLRKLSTAVSNSAKASLFFSIEAGLITVKSLQHELPEHRIGQVIISICNCNGIVIIEINNLGISE